MTLTKEFPHEFLSKTVPHNSETITILVRSAILHFSSAPSIRSYVTLAFFNAGTAPSSFQYTNQFGSFPLSRPFLSKNTFLWSSFGSTSTSDTPSKATSSENLYLPWYPAPVGSFISANSSFQASSGIRFFDQLKVIPLVAGASSPSPRSTILRIG